MRSILLIPAALLLPLTACNPFGDMQKREPPPAALKGLTQTMAVDRKEGERIILEAGHFDLPLTQGWVAMRMMGVTQLRNPRCGETLQAFGFKPPEPLDDKQQEELLAALTTRASQAERMLGKIAGITIGETKIEKRPWGYAATVPARGPLIRVGIHWIGVSRDGAVMAQMDGQDQDGCDVAADAAELFAGAQPGNRPAPTAAATTKTPPAPPAPIAPTAPKP